MKLVTGIEAIQSGKRFRRAKEVEGTIVKSCIFGEWIHPQRLFGHDFTPRELLLCEWEIEQEPREFWVDPKGDEGAYLQCCRAECAHMDFKKAGWIKVREIIE